LWIKIKNFVAKIKGEKIMTKKKFWLAFVVLVLLVGLVIDGCDNVNGTGKETEEDWSLTADTINGEWKGILASGTPNEMNVTFSFDYPDWNWKDNDSEEYIWKGSFSIDTTAKTMTFTPMYSTEDGTLDGMYFLGSDHDLVKNPIKHPYEIISEGVIKLGKVIDGGVPVGS
jgi:hypothetical protein